METTTAPVCPECNGRIVSESDEQVCGACGLVLEGTPLDRGPDWRRDEPSKKRTGAPLTRLRHDRGLSTRIGFRGESGNAGRRKLQRIRRQHNRARIRSKAERNRMNANLSIRRLGGDLGVPPGLIERACVLFESAQSADLVRGRSIEGFAAATIYAACRTAGVSRTITEVVSRARADRNELQAAYDALNRELGLQTGPIDPGEYVARFADRLEVPDRVERRARDFLEDAREGGVVSGRDPSGVAAGCLYAAARAADHDLTQAAAADVADVSCVTVRSTYQAITE
jgi:transcription initiation factor TFIIB